MDVPRRSSESTRRRRSLLPLANEQEDYVPAFYRPRSAVEGRRRSSLERRSVSSLEDSQDLDGACLSPRLTPRSNVTPRRVREEDGIGNIKEKSSSRGLGAAATRASEQLKTPLRPDTPFQGPRSSSRGARGSRREPPVPPRRRASDRENSYTSKNVEEEKEIKRKVSGILNKDVQVEKSDSKIKGRAGPRPPTPLVTSSVKPMVRRTSKKRLDRPSESADSTNVTPRSRDQRLTSVGGSEGSACNSRASSRRSSIASISRSSSKLSLSDPPGPDTSANPTPAASAHPPGRRPNMATLLNVLQFKRNFPSMRRKQNARRPSLLAAASETIDEKEELELLEADPLAAPAGPGQRFALGLSKEAQYAMLKGYEDRIQQEISDDAPTPRTVPDSTEAFRDLARASTGDTAYSTKMNWKLENAMDIIDCLLSTNGHNVTSERFRNKVSDPVRHYRRWSRACDHDVAMARVKLQVQTEGNS